ncbi:MULTISPECIES: Fur family transcriptional regulator [unclassified Streptococcus]|uniref:Fur family transcriptional regulator n=1 Tax=unclassified Streptococcus TaxID=2608887 RepID=UPI0018A8E5C0|nr:MULTISPECIES: Fur family transcriptional regulator [unclassified Streptococcus]MBF8970764.1 transcriptional repressor [Streptococcus sp. NLN76]MBG9366810.1 transcriptional repressor [Streptococcus sp. NLN64]MBJ6745229.1 transcriptional repressor [Streptococcus sp. 121]
MAHKLEGILEELREHGIRVTEARRLMLEYLMNSHEHPSAEKIYQDLMEVYPQISLATVYNNLNLFLKEGLVTEIKIKNDQTRYYDFMGHEHINIVCENCGKIADFEGDGPPDISVTVREQTGYELRKQELLVYGLCPDCQKLKG